MSNPIATYQRNKIASHLPILELSTQLYNKAIEQNRLPSRFSHIRIGCEELLRTVYLTLLLTPCIAINNFCTAILIACKNEASQRRSQLIRYHITSSLVQPTVQLGSLFVTVFIRITALALGILHPKISAYGYLLASKITIAEMRFLASLSRFMVSELPFKAGEIEVKPIGLPPSIKRYLGENVCQELFKEIHPQEFPTNIEIKDADGNILHTIATKEKDRYGYVVCPKEPLITTPEDY